MNHAKPIGGDSIRVVQPLFPVEGAGSIPSSPLQLKIDTIPRDTFLSLNKMWHSRLPKCGNCWSGLCFGAHYKNMFYAVAWWSHPIAQNRLRHGKHIYELRRMAINSDAPKNTASRFLKIMGIIIKQELPNIYKFISYQDTGVHCGTIYKASGWTSVETQKKGFQSWKNRVGRTDQSDAIKIRWEKQIKPEPERTKKEGSSRTFVQEQMTLF